MLKILFRENETAHPMQAICPWIDFITPELVLNKDGSILAGFEYRGADPDDLFEEEIDATAAQIQLAFTQLDERVMAWWIVDKRIDNRYPESTFSNETSEEIDRLYSEEFTTNKKYSIRYNLFLLFTGVTGTSKFLDRVSRIQKENGEGILSSVIGAIKESLSGRAAFSLEEGMLQENIYTFERVITNFRNLSPLKLTRLVGDDFTTALGSILNRANDHTALRKPTGCMLDSWLPNNYVSNGNDIIRFKGNSKTIFAAALGMKWPETTRPMLFEEVIKMDMELTICQITRFLGKEASENEINKAIEYYNLTQFGMISHAIAKATDKTPDPKPGKAQLLDESKLALEQIGALGLTFAYQNITVFVYGESKQLLKRNVDLMISRLSNAKFVTLRERENTFPSFAAMLPGQWAMQTRYELVSIENVADIAPIYTMDAGDEIHQFFSDSIFKKPVPAFTTFGNLYGGKAHFSPHVGQVGHMVIIAPTGVGKTTFVNFCISQFQRYGDVGTYIFDRNRSCEIITKLHGGTHINITSKNLRLNPFFAMMDKSTDGRQWVRGFILNRLAEGGFEASADDRNTIDGALDILANSDQKLRMSTLAAMLPRRIVSELAEWLQDGPFGMFDNEDDDFELSNWTTIEMREIMANDRLSRAFMEYAFRKIYNSLTGRPTFIYLEEATFLLNNPKFKDIIDDWLKTFRKKNAFIWMTIQSPDAITSSDISASLCDNVFSYLLLYNMKVEQHRPSYKKYFGLEDHQIDIIGKLRKNKQYLIVQDGKARVLDTSFSPKVLSYLRSEQSCLNEFDKVMSEGEDDWKSRYLERVSKIK